MPSHIKRPSKKSWFIIHILMPLIPFFLGGIIKYITTNTLNWSTFSSSHFAISIAILSLLINQSLLNNEVLLNNEDKIEDIFTSAQVYIVYSILLSGLFALTEGYRCSVYDLGISSLVNPLRTSELFSYALGFSVIIHSFITQNSYKLSARL